MTRRVPSRRMSRSTVPAAPVTRKNAKVRRLRELYPEIRVEVVYQRDFRALLERHGATGVVVDDAGEAHPLPGFADYLL